MSETDKFPLEALISTTTHVRAHLYTIEDPIAGKVKWAVQMFWNGLTAYGSELIFDTYQDAIEYGKQEIADIKKRLGTTPPSNL